MTEGSIFFMVISWAAVLALTGWCYYRLITGRK